MPTLNWIGKDAVEKHHKEVPFRLLEPVAELSCGESDSGNLIVQGDNLHALKALLPRYGGQVKCIYIDPPYNTGNEGWVYNDNVNSPEIQKWLGKVVGKEGETLDRHDRWLCMLYPRLLLLKQFLSNDGVVFVSIDDNENHHLRLLLDEIFGGRNFVANVLWQKRTSPDSRLSLGDAHEHIICYAKDKAKIQFNKIPQSEKQISNFKNHDGDTRGPWVSTDFSAQGFRPNQMYPVVTPSGRVVTPPAGHCWKNTEEVFLSLVADRRIWFGKKGSGVPRRKTFLSESGGVSPWTWWSNQDVGHSQEATKEFKSMMHDGGLIFDTPKPTRLIQRILQIATDQDSIVMDSFAGSGTTGHSVLMQNVKDGGRRKFILIEMDSDVAEKVTSQRLLKACKGYIDVKTNTVEALGSGFQFCKLSQEALFRPDGPIRSDVTFEQLAEFVWFMETGTGRNQSNQKHKHKHKYQKYDTPYLGQYKDRVVFLLYNGILNDKSDIGGNVLNGRTLELLDQVLPNFEGIKIVYGARSRFDKTKLDKLGITFHQLPYELAVKTWF